MTAICDISEPMAASEYALSGGIENRKYEVKTQPRGRHGDTLAVRIFFKTDKRFIERRKHHWDWSNVSAKCVGSKNESLEGSYKVTKEGDKFKVVVIETETHKRRNFEIDG